MGLKAVVVDDEMLTVEALTKLIPLCCPEIEVVGNADNGKTALELIHTIEPDLAVVDINMPIINGIQLIQMLKEEGTHTKIVVLSAYREFEYAMDALNYGAYAYLLKPINMENVKKTMTELAAYIQKERTALQVQKKYVEILPDWGTNLLLKFLKGRLSPEEMQQEAAAMQLKFPKEFRTVLIKLLPMEGGMVGNGMAREVLASFQEKYILSAEQGSDEIILVIRFEGAYNLLALIEKKLTTGGIPCVLYMGEKCHSYQELYLSFQKIKETEWFHFYHDFTGCIVKCEEYSYFGGKWKNFLLDSAVIKQWIHEKDQEEILKYFRRCAAMWKKEQSISPKQVYQAVYELILIFKAEVPITDAGLRYALDSLSLEDLKKYTTLSALTKYTEGLLNQIFHENQNSADNSQGIGSDKVIIMVKDYCSKHYGEDISLDAISNYVNMSKNYFCNYFKKNTGENFVQYLKKLRIDIAMRKLREGNEKIGDVAETVGYRNVSHFSKMFKEETGISPVEYRNRRY